MVEYSTKGSKNRMGRHSEERNRDEESLYSYFNQKWC